MSHATVVHRRLLWSLCLLLTVVGALSGCAAPRELRTEVSSFGSWPPARQPGSYVFERLPSQQSQPVEQEQLEAAAQPALAGAGFALLASTVPPEQAAYTVQIGADVRLDRRQTQDPFLNPWWPYGPYGVYRPGVYPSVGGWWGPGHAGLGMSMMVSPQWIQMQVSVLIRDRRSNALLYETRAGLERTGAAEPRLWAPLFQAAMQDFPQPGGSPRTVVVPLNPESKSE
jgi:hypothetical protein